MNAYRLISCFFSFLCFALFLVVHCSNSWSTYQPLMGVYTIGLWTICSDKNGCRKMSGVHVFMELTRIFMLLALLGSFMAFVWAIEWDHVFHCNFTFLPKSFITSICNFVAGTSLMIGLVMFEIETARVNEKKISAKNWAFYLSCATGILCYFIVMVQLGAGWAQYDRTTHPFYLGLWTICSEEKCTSLEIREVKLDFTRIFMLAAVFTSLVAIVFSVDWNFFKKCGPNFHPQALAAATFNILTEIFVVIAVVIFDASIKESKPSAERKAPVKLWAFYISCVTAILSFLTGIYNLILYKFSLWDTPVSDLPVSSESGNENSPL